MINENNKIDNMIIEKMLKKKIKKIKLNKKKCYYYRKNYRMNIFNFLTSLIR